MKQISVRIDDELHEAFRLYASAQERSINGQIVWMMKEAVREMGSLPKRGGNEYHSVPLSVRESEDVESSIPEENLK